MRTILTISLSMLGACAGDAPPYEADAGTGPSDPPAETVPLTGEIRDHFVPLTLLPASAITSEAVTPRITATSSDDGSYVLERVPVGTQLFATVSRPGYRPTRNPATLVTSQSTQDLAAISITDARRQYVTLGKTPVSGTAILIVNIEDGPGALALARVSLVDDAGEAVPGVLGPYAFGTAGDIDPAATTTVIAQGRSRIAFLDLPPGTFSVRINFPSSTVTKPVIADADGAVLATMRDEQSPTVNLDPSFALDIHPRLQTAANGGLGCANCHTLGGSGAVLELDGPPELVLERLKTRPGILDMATPTASRLLVKPTYESAMPDHPNATFLDANDPDYQLLQRWIANGAKP